MHKRSNLIIDIKKKGLTVCFLTRVQFKIVLFISYKADTSVPPDITITEDNTIPPEEGSDVLAYFGIKNPGQILLQYKTNIWYSFRF